MYDIPEVVENLYFSNMVDIPDQKDWPDYIGGSRSVGEKLYSFYAGLQLGMQFSDACRAKGLTPMQCDDGNLGPVKKPEGGAGIP